MSSRSQLFVTPPAPLTQLRSPAGPPAGGLARETTSPPRAGAGGATGGDRAGAVLRRGRAVTLLLAALAAPLLAADGDLDPTFRSGGTFLYNVPSQGGVALGFRGDGAPVVGYTALLAGTDKDMRVLPVPDQGLTTYCGSYHPDLGGTDADILTDIAVNGYQVFVAGSAAGPSEDPARRAAVAAFSLTNCALDSSFGGADGVIIDYGTDTDPVAVVLASGGAVRSALNRNAGTDTEFLRTLGLQGGDGLLDGGFTVNPVNFVDEYGASGFRPSDMIRQPDGKLLVVGTVELPNGDRDIGVVRFNAGGALDTTFSLDGLVAFSYDIVDAGADDAFAIAVLPDRRIVVAGRAQRGTGYHAAVAVLTPTGGYDNGFGVVGRYVFPFGDGPRGDTLTAVATQGDGKIVVGGWSAPGTGVVNYDFAVARLLSAGDSPLDPTFGTDGFQEVAFDYGGTYGDAIRDLALDPGGRIVATGSVMTGSVWGVGVVRLENGYIFADGFEWGSTAAWH